MGRSMQPFCINIVCVNYACLCVAWEGCFCVPKGSDFSAQHAAIFSLQHSMHKTRKKEPQGAIKGNGGFAGIAALLQSPPRVIVSAQGGGGQTLLQIEGLGPPRNQKNLRASRQRR